MPNPNPRPCVVFDFDGTLVDSVAAIVTAVNGTLEHAGFPTRDPKDIVDHMGRGLRPLYAWATGNDDAAAIQRIVASTRVRYRGIWREHTKIFPGIPELLVALRDRGAALTILSNKGHEATVEVAEGLFSADRFDMIHGISDDWPGKPNPWGLLSMLDAVGSAPHRALMVGDMSVDVRVGRAAGVTTVGVEWGFQGVAAFAEDPPDLMVASPEGILDAYDTFFSG